MTSWNTHLGSEEYEPDARLLTLDYELFKNASVVDGNWNVDNILNFLRYYGIYYPTYENDMDLIRSVFNPCEYHPILKVFVCITNHTLTQSIYRFDIQNRQVRTRDGIWAR